jgi:hypothetical protein
MVLGSVGRRLYLLFAFDVGLDGHGLAAVVEREAVVGTLLQRQTGDIKNTRPTVICSGMSYWEEWYILLALRSYG